MVFYTHIMENHLLLKNFYEDIYKSKAGKLFQSVYRQSTFFSNKKPLA